MLKILAGLDAHILVSLESASCSRWSKVNSNPRSQSDSIMWAKIRDCSIRWSWWGQIIVTRS